MASQSQKPITPAPLSTDHGRKRDCWECIRRRVVCDSGRPVCNRCSVSKIVCPGYDDSRPLRWLAPGKVNARRRKPKTKTSTTEVVGNDNNQTITTAVSSIVYAHPPLREIVTEAQIFREGMDYYNTCIYEDLKPIQELGRNPAIYRVTENHLKHSIRAPDYFRYVFVCVVLSHRFNRTRDDPESKALIPKLYQYRGLVIRSLLDDINLGKKRHGDIVAAGITSLLLADAQQGASADWICHLDAIQRFISARGGYSAVASPSADPFLICYLYISTIGATTAPASTLETLPCHFKELGFMVQRYNDRAFRLHLIPPPLFTDIIRINRLRRRAAARLVDMGALTQEAYDILNRINSFSAEQWASSKSTCKDDWVLMAKCCRASTAIYCISSLQSLNVLPAEDVLDACRITHGELLYDYLKVALKSPRIRVSALWPLIVLGVEAATHNINMRGFVQRELDEMSSYKGTNTPLLAKWLLERYWSSGESSWDACFDKPYPLVTPIAIDVSSILPLL